ncbi:hypothetical protein [Cellulomonas humilata]|uniref:Uncharacterized protein n=1 Tax=Cellulomonas humilata TaxID=144055 RepID=A0ABU0E9X6_9CELL|nr:hypothetical protein [Cellulomonas humilata]MDQ0372059.1 hypothetical protein [Cellulomonas humilata]
MRWASDDFPGWIQAVVLDAHGRRHQIVEKVPVLTSLVITADSSLPIEFWLSAEMESIRGDEVAVSFSHGVATTDGVKELTISSADVLGL